jgi:hypothetical protein
MCKKNDKKEKNNDVNRIDHFDIDGAVDRSGYVFVGR